MHFLLGPLLAAAAAAAPTAAADPGIYGTLIPLIPLLPILGFAFTALFGRRLQAKGGRTAAELVPVGVVVVVWVIAMIVVVPALQHTEPFGEHGPGRQALDLDPGRGLHGRPRVPRGRADRGAPDRRDDDRHARAHLLDRVHGARPGHVAVLRLPQPVHVLDARARPGQQLAAGVRGLGAGGPVLLLADRVLVPQAVRGAGRQEGVHRQPRRRRGLRARDHGHLGQHGDDEHPGSRSRS